MSTAFYLQYYRDMSERDWQWRELGGRVKAENIACITYDLLPESILDIGCGTGAVLVALTRLGFGRRYYAIDVAEPPVQLVRQRPDLPGLIEAQVFNGSNIPYGTQQFDLAILSHVIEHIPDPVPVIQEAARVARYVVIEVPLEDNLYTRLQVHLFGSGYREAIGHIQWFSRHSFQHLLQRQCGLHIIRAQMAPVPEPIYTFRKPDASPIYMKFQIQLRRLLFAASPQLYARLLPDHYIALASGVV
jgi:SAM-dependent methyltransferase